MRDQDGTVHTIRVGLHIHLYVWLSLVAISVIPFFVGLWLAIDTEPLEALLSGLALLVSVQVLFWITRRACTDEALTFWEGLVIVAANMAIGVGPFSVVLAFFALTATVTIGAGYALAGLARQSKEYAPARYKRLVAWFHKYRMHQ